MSGAGLNYLTNQSYNIDNKTTVSTANKTTSTVVTEQKGVIELKLDKELNVPKNDSLKIDLTEKPTNNNTFKLREFEFVTETDHPLKMDAKAPESRSRASIVDFDPSKHVSSENADFFYVNGIMTNPEDAEHTANILSGIIGKDVEKIWSKKEGFFGDLVKSVKIDQANTNRTLSSQTASEISTKVIDSLTKGKNVKLIAHSRGGSETANALWDVRSRLAVAGLPMDKINEMMNKIEVITMGGLASPSDFPSDVKLIQIRNPNDPVPKLNKNKLDNNDRKKYSTTEIQIANKVLQNNGKPLRPDERVAIYAKNIDSGEIKNNIREKLSNAANTFWPEINTVTSVAGGAVAGRVLLKNLPKKGYSFASVVSDVSNSLASKAGISLKLGKNSKVIAVGVTDATKIKSGFAANTVKALVNTSMKMGPKTTRVTIKTLGKAGITVFTDAKGVAGITIGNVSRRAIQRASAVSVAKGGSSFVKVGEVSGGSFKIASQSFNSSMNIMKGSTKLGALDSKIVVNPKMLAVAGAVVVSGAIYFALKKVGSDHLVNAGSNNYLGEKSVQEKIKNEANN